MVVAQSIANKLGFFASVGNLFRNPSFSCSLFIFRHVCSHNNARIVYLAFLLCLYPSVTVVLSAFSTLQGIVGHPGDRGEPGDPGYDVSLISNGSYVFCNS